MEFDFDDTWNVDKTAENLNTSLFGSDKKRKKRQNSLFSPKKGKFVSAVIHDSDDEKFTKKGKKKLKNRNRKLKKKQAGAVGDVEVLVSSLPNGTNQISGDNKMSAGNSESKTQNGQPDTKKKKRQRKKKKVAESSGGDDNQLAKPNEKGVSSKFNTASKKHPLQEKSQLEQQNKHSNIETKAKSKKRKRGEDNMEDMPKMSKKMKMSPEDRESSVSKPDKSKTTVDRCSNGEVMKESKKKKRNRKKERKVNKQESSAKDSQHTSAKETMLNGFMDSMMLSMDSEEAEHPDKLKSKKKKKKRNKSKEKVAQKSEPDETKDDGTSDSKSSPERNNESRNRKLDKNVLKKLLASSDAARNNHSSNQVESSLNPTSKKAKKAQKAATGIHSSKKTPVHSQSDAKSSQLNPVWGSGSSLAQSARETLNSARFRYLNEQLYTCTGQEARGLFRQDREAFEVYHDGYRGQVAKWEVNPLDTIIKQIKDKAKSLVIADLGCGEGVLADSVPQMVHSFDLVALRPHVTACDMAKLPLANESADIAVFCLSLMGTNLDDYIAEANRILKPGGLLKVAEVVSRFSGLNPFISGVCAHGFSLLNKRELSKMFYLMDFKKVNSGKKTSGNKSLTLKPCIYKKR